MNRKLKTGFSLLELVLAVAIFSLGSVAMATMLIDSNLSTKLSLDRTDALFYAKEGMEAVQSIRNNDWDTWSTLDDGDYSLASSSGGLWSFGSSTDLINSKYTRTVNLTTSSSSETTKDVSVTVSWPLTPSRDASVVLNTVLTNWISVVNFSCGSTLTDTRDDKTYTTILIGSQCWMKQNINVGTITASTNNQGTGCPSAAEIEKYCYSNTESNCTTYGGLYQWNQAMCGSTTAGTQGICPIGWHIPTHDEFTTLERAVCSSGSCATDFPYDTSTTGWRGTNEGTNLKIGGASSFKANLGGEFEGGSFVNITSDTQFWLSSAFDANNGWYRRLQLVTASIYRQGVSKTSGLSIRCLND